MSGYVLSPEAMQDLQSIWDFIAADNLNAADNLLDELFDAFEKLAEWPRQGHTRLDLTDRNVRFWPVGAYLVVYREGRTQIQIAAILHGARDVPNLLEGRI